MKGRVGSREFEGMRALMITRFCNILGGNFERGNPRNSSNSGRGVGGGEGIDDHTFLQHFRR